MTWAHGVCAETDVWNKFLSGWSGDKARESTLEIQPAPASEDFRQAMDALSAAVAVDVADQMGALSAESSSVAEFYCLQTFIQQNYSPALLTAFQDACDCGRGPAADLLGDNSNVGIMGAIEGACRAG